MRTSSVPLLTAAEREANLAELGHLSPACSPECEADFSSTRCQGCGSFLAGDRHTVADDDGELLRVCVDCLMAVANGDPLACELCDDTGCQCEAS